MTENKARSPGCPRWSLQLLRTARVPDRDTPLVEWVSIVHVVANDSPSEAAELGLDVTNPVIVRRLVTAYEKRRPLSSRPSEPAFPWVVFFAGNTAESSAFVGFEYDPDGVIREALSRELLSATKELRHTLNALIEDRRALLEVRDGFCEALLRSDWSGVEGFCGPRLAGRTRRRAAELATETGLVLERARLVAWRDQRNRGRRASPRRAEGFQQLHGFVGRLKLGEQGRSWWLELLMDRRAEGWRIGDCMLTSSGRQRPARHFRK